jgi:molybdopterin-guanine dinucleotide biosynthesis protein A
LILIGGKSSRMGTDKSLLNYHGKSQRAFLFDLAKKYCSEVYFSAREEQIIDEKTIIDSYSFGPIGGILSAFENNKNVAWLVIACDMPLVNEASFEILIQNRNPAKIATAFFNPENNAPEPLFTIYEPKALNLLLEFIKLGNRSPKKFLQNADIQLVMVNKSRFLTNVNTKEEFEKMKNNLTTE